MWPKGESEHSARRPDTECTRPPAVELASQVPKDAEEHVVRCERDQLLRVHVRGGAEDPATFAAASLEDPNFST